VTDAFTAYVLKVNISPPKKPYIQQDDDLMRMVQIVKHLCLPYVGPQRTVSVDCFYTSINLMKELDKLELHAFGMAMRTCVPKELTIAKNSTIFTNMSQGDYTNHTNKYEDNFSTVPTYGLVCWKDRDMIYCLSTIWCR
jgi:Transposase IS4